MLTGRKRAAAASKQAYTEEAVRIYEERRWLMSENGLWIEQDGRPVHLKNLKLKQANGVLAKRYGWGDNDRAFDKWLRRGLPPKKQSPFFPNVWGWDYP